MFGMGRPVALNRLWHSGAVRGVATSRLRLVSAFLVCGLLSACGAPATPPPEPLGSCTLTLPDNTSDEDAIRAVIRAEGELMVAQSIDALMALWSDDSLVADAKNTPDNTDDDQQWLGKDAIRHRYVRTVFPGNPGAAAPADLQFEITDGRAVVRSTTNIGNEVAPAGDRWELSKRGNCWEILSLTYNLEPQQ